MFKNILILGLMCTILTAQSSQSGSQIDFDTFLRKALLKSPYLAASSLSISQAKEIGASLTRYENPNLELEYSSFNPQIGNTEDGYRLNYSQAIRLWGVGDDKELLSKNILKSASSQHSLKKALFIRSIALSFTDYSEQKMLLILGEEELSIAQKIYDISQARYDSGTISKALLLQSKIDYELIEIQNSALSLRTTHSYYELLKFAGIDEELNLNTAHIFTTELHTQSSKNPTLKALQAHKQESLSEAQVNSNTVEWINLTAEYESEPGQDIARVGISFPLALFNTKAQEKKIATLEASRSQLLIDNEKKILNIESKRLLKERGELKNLLFKNRQLLMSELQLLEMFQDGYKISNINLLQLQDIKNKMISTKRTIIELTRELNQNAIILNYNQGKYND